MLLQFPATPKEESVNIINFGTSLLAAAPTVAVDFGTYTIAIRCSGSDKTFIQKTCIERKGSSGSFDSWGNEAAKKDNKTDKGVNVIWPVQQGVVVDFNAGAELIKRAYAAALEQAGITTLKHPIIYTAHPDDAQADDVRNLVNLFRQTLSPKKIFITTQAFAAAIGANLNISNPDANCVVDIGGGTTDVAVISNNGIVFSDSVSVGGLAMNEAISKEISQRFGFSIGPQQAEEIKHRIGAACEYDAPEADKSMEIYGKGTKNIAEHRTLDYTVTVAALNKLVIPQILGKIQSMLTFASPDLASSIIKRGIVLTGGGSMLNRIKERIQLEYPHIPVVLSTETKPDECAVAGLEKMMHNHQIYCKVLADMTSANL